MKIIIYISSWLCFYLLNWNTSTIIFSLILWNSTTESSDTNCWINCVPSLQQCAPQTSNSCGRMCRGCRAVRRPWNRPRAWTWAPTALILPQPSPKLPALTSHCTACPMDRATPQRETGIVMYSMSNHLKYPQCEGVSVLCVTRSLSNSYTLAMSFSGL